MNELPRTLKLATVWLLIGTAVFLAVQYLQAERQRTAFEVRGERIEIRRADDGHYHWPGSINGHAVDFLVDTGATSTALPIALARQLQLASVGSVRSNTANGEVVGQVVLADLALEGGVQVQRLRATALPQLGDKPLLGMDVLGRLDWQQRGGVLVIERRDAR